MILFHSMKIIYRYYFLNEKCLINEYYISAQGSSFYPLFISVSVKSIVKIFVVSCSGNNNHLHCFPVRILINLPLSECFLYKKLPIEVFPFTDLQLDIVISKSGISVDEPLTTLNVLKDFFPSLMSFHHLISGGAVQQSIYILLLQLLNIRRLNNRLINNIL